MSSLFTEVAKQLLKAGYMYQDIVLEVYMGNSQGMYQWLSLWLGSGGLCSILAVFAMLLKTTFMLQPHAYYAHTMLMNIITLLHLAPMHVDSF